MRSKYWILLTLAAIALVTAFGPREQTLGANLRLVTLHGAMVWTGKLVFGAAALAGLAALVSRRRGLAALSQALGRTGLLFWLTYLPMSLLLMQLTWNGLFFDEPRWRVPFSFGVAAVLLQAALWLINHPDLTSLGNLAFGAALWWRMGGLGTVLHPTSAISASDSLRIQLFFVALLILTLLFALQFTRLIYRPQRAA